MAISGSIQGRVKATKPTTSSTSSLGSQLASSETSNLTKKKKKSSSSSSSPATPTSSIVAAGKDATAEPVPAPADVPTTGSQMLSREYVATGRVPVDPTPTPISSPTIQRAFESSQQVDSSVRREAATPDLPLQNQKPKDLPFLSVAGQKQRFQRAADTYNLALRQVGNVMVPGQPFTEKPANMTSEDKLTQVVTSPAFIFGAPAAIATVKTAPGVKETLKTLSMTETGQFITRGTKGMVGAAALTKGGQLAGDISLTKEQAALFKDPRVTEAFLETREEAPDIQRAVSAEQFKGGFSDVVSGTIDIFTEGEFKQGFSKIKGGRREMVAGGLQFVSAAMAEEIPAFGRAAEEGESEAMFRGKLKEEGFSPGQIDIAVEGFEKKAFSEDVGQLAGVIFSGREAEALGRSTTAKVAPKTFSEGFLKTGGRIGQAGFFEGASIDLTGQMLKQKDIDWQRVSGAAAIGGVSASIPGGIMGGLSPQKGGKAFEKVIYALDPSEPLGDITQDIFEKQIRRSSSKVITFGGAPTLTSTAPTTPASPETTMSYSFTKTGQPTVSLTPVESSAPKGPAAEVVSIQPSTDLFTPSKGKGKGKGNPFTVAADPTTDTLIDTPVDTPVDVPTNPFANVPTEPTTKVPTNPFTSVPTDPFTNVPVSISVVTPQNPVPFFFPGSGSGSRAKSRLRKVSQPKDFVSSLGASVLGIKGAKTEAGVLTGLGIRPLQNGGLKRTTKPRKKKHR